MRNFKFSIFLEKIPCTGKMLKMLPTTITGPRISCKLLARSCLAKAVRKKNLAQKLKILFRLFFFTCSLLCRLLFMI